MFIAIDEKKTSIAIDGHPSIAIDGFSAVISKSCLTTYHSSSTYHRAWVLLAALGRVGARGAGPPAENIAQLTLKFKHCIKLSDVPALAALGGLQNFAQLTLDFSGCRELSDVSALAALGGL